MTAQVGNESTNLSPKILASEEKATTLIIKKVTKTSFSYSNFKDSGHLGIASCAQNLSSGTMHLCFRFRLSCLVSTTGSEE